MSKEDHEKKWAAQFDPAMNLDRVAEGDYMKRLLDYDLRNQGGHRVETFDIHRFDDHRMVPDFNLDQGRIDFSTVRDEMREAYRCRLSTWLATKKTSKVVKLEEDVTLAVKVFDTWFDHFLSGHPWLQRIFGKPKTREITKKRRVSKTETVDFGAVIPEMQIPEEVLKSGRTTFQVYYRILD